MEQDAKEIILSLINKPDSIAKDVILSLSGVIVGFILSEGVTYLKTRKEITREGETFELEILALKPALEKQIADLNKLKAEIISFHDTAADISLFKVMDYFKQVDRRKLNLYFNRKNKNNGQALLRNKLNSVNVIAFEVDRLIKHYEEYSQMLGTQLGNYKMVADTFQRYIAEYMLLHNANEPYAIEISKILMTELHSKATTNILTYRDSLHKKLLAMDYENRHHQLHPEILKFNQEGSDIISKVEMEMNTFLNALDTISESLENRGKHLQ